MQFGIVKTITYFIKKCLRKYASTFFRVSIFYTKDKIYLFHQHLYALLTYFHDNNITVTEIGVKENQRTGT